MRLLVLVHVIEHQFKRLIVILVATHFKIIVVEIATTRFVDISDVRRLVAPVHFVRVLRIGIDFETLTLHNLPSLQNLIGGWIGSYGSLLDLSVRPRVQIVPIIGGQFCSTLQDVVALVVVADIHLALVDILVDGLVRNGVARRKQSVLVAVELCVLHLRLVHQLRR